MIYHFNAPALEYNVSGWMNFLGPWNEKKEQEIQHYFDFLENNQKEEKWLSEVMKVQQADVKDDLPSHVKEFLKGDEKVFLLACNVLLLSANLAAAIEIGRDTNRAHFGSREDKLPHECTVPIHAIPSLIIPLSIPAGALSHFLLKARPTKPRHRSQPSREASQVP
jgi:hypothetical protein